MSATANLPRLSVILCTHRPDRLRLSRTLSALALQDLPRGDWECLLVDNASGEAFPAELPALSRLSNLRLLQEPALGLSHARRRGCLESKAPVLVYVDDDNLLCPDYLSQVLRFFEKHGDVGCLGGRCIPEFEARPERWHAEFFDLLALRDLGPVPLFSPAPKEQPLSRYPECAPVGAGMALRKEALATWLDNFSTSTLPDRQGNKLSSSGDNDLVLHILRAGWRAAYSPDLFLVHLIPAGRLEKAYLGRLNRSIQCSWMQVLAWHGLNPWKPIAPWTLALRRARAHLRRKPAQSAEAWVRWQGDCGHFEGRCLSVSAALKASVRSLGLGRLAYLLFHYPAGKLRDLKRDGGPLARRRTLAGRALMRSAAAKLPPSPDFAEAGPALEVHLLTGHRFWDQSLLCLWSLATQSGRTLIPHIYDDGSLKELERDTLRSVFPSTRFTSREETLARLDQCLPQSRFPNLRERWLKYPNIRKLTDVHVGSSGWKLVIDSDMLFFKKPELLMHWLEQPRTPLHGIDCKESYGYSRALIDTLAGTPPATAVNVGLCGLRSEEIDWEKLEWWTARLHKEEGTNYYLEQALVAMLLAGRSCTVAPQNDYLTLPSRSECLKPTAIMHHYVDSAKRWYFTECWPLVMPPTARTKH